MRKILPFTASLLLGLSIVSVQANTFTASQNGTWNASATWGGAGVPKNGDIAIIPPGITVTIDGTSGTVNLTYQVFDFNNPSRMEVFGTLNVNGSPSATNGFVFQNPVNFEIYSGGVAKDNDVEGAFNFVETSTFSVYPGGSFYVWPNGGAGNYTTLIYDLTVSPFGSVPPANEPFILGNDGTYYNGNNPILTGPFTLSVVPSASFNNITFVETTKPSSVTSAATNVGSTTVTLNGTVSAGGLATNNIQFEYSTNATLASGVSTAPASPASLSAAAGATLVTKALTGLLTNTQYYYRVNATNTLGTTQGNILSFTTSGTVPVRFISFTAQPAGNNVNLAWTVGVNEQAKNYEVYHSTDGVNFSAVGEINNTPDQKSYYFTDAHEGAGTHYYRILEVDIDGESVYSPIATAKIAENDFSITTLNNPAAPGTDAQLQINTANAGTAIIELWSTGGAKLALQQHGVGTGTNTVDIPMNQLKAGVYIVKVTLNDHTQVTRVIKR